MSSGALVVGAGAAVGVLAADMSAQWSEQAAVKAAAQVVEDPGNDATIPRAVIVTRIKERHVTPKAVVVHRKVYVRAPSAQGAARVQAPQKRTVRSAPKPRPSRRVVAPAPAAPKPAASAPKATSKTS